MTRWTRLAAVVMVAVIAVGAYAEPRNYSEKIRASQTALEQMINTPGNTIPAALFRDCKAIAIFPSVVRAGFVFGGRYGEGVVLTRDTNNKWSAPAFFTITGGNWGLQAGVQSSDIVLFIMNQRGLEALLKQKFTIGADMAATAGPNSVNAEGNIDVALKADIYSYVRSRGLFAGIAVNGARMAFSPRMNREYYTRSFTVDDIIIRREATALADAQALVQKLESLGR